MKNKVNLLLTLMSVCFCFFTESALAVSKDTLWSKDLNPFGRFTQNADGNLELISSAVHFGFHFTGSGCMMFASLSAPGIHNYLQYVVDGVYSKRIRISGNSPQRYEISGLGKGVHTIWIYKATEASTGPVFIKMVSGRNISAVRVSKLPLIEFIGNSITCGAAADPSEIPCGKGEYHDQHNAYYAYGPRVARALNMNFILSSVSGIGIYRNWNSLSPTMPQVYEHTDFQDDSLRKWDFKRYAPEIVSIALGTNDYSNGDGIKPRLPFDSAVFVNTYIEFVALVKSKYPKARIALLSSPMINGSRREILQHCLMAVKIKTDQKYPLDKKIALFFFEPMQARGCGGHPNVEDHAILAKELEPFFKSLL